jgi:glycerol-1-phosphate dehydrogenase [NAD(P)+]
MSRLPYDPAENDVFWEKIRQLPGFPKEDVIPLRQMIFEPGAIFRLPEILRTAGVRFSMPILAVMDATPMRRDDDSLKPLIIRVLRQAGWEVETFVLEADATGQVHTDMPHIEAVKARLSPEKAVVSIGSGVVTDITKHACYLYEQEIQRPVRFIVYQTANSVSAYTSNMAPVFIGGVKRTLPSRYPDALVCDLETLRDAPRDMTVSGVGDLLAAFVALADWYLADQLGFIDHYSLLPELLMGSLDELLLEQAEAIHQGSLEAMALLAKLISLGGLVMSLCHDTTPLSGYEHVMSHVLDLQSELAGRPFALHGTQVALTTILGAAAYQQFLECFEPDSVKLDDCFPPQDMMRQMVFSTFHAIDPSDKAGQECWSDYHVKLEKWRDRRNKFEAFLKNWPTIKPELASRTRSPDYLKRIFAAVGGPCKFAQLAPPADEATVRFAFLNAPLIRKRITLGDLLIFLKWDRKTLWQQIWHSTQSC